MSSEDKNVKGLTENGELDAPLPFFSSARERRLWLWTLAVVGAIYATLGLPTKLVGVLFKEDLFGAIFFYAFLLIGVAILTQGLKMRPRGFEIGVGLGAAAVYLMVFSRLGIPERTHLFEYGVLALFMYEALTERAGNGRRVPIPALLAIGATALIGALDEGIQALLPNRVFDLIDILFNAFAGLMAVLASVALAWARRLGNKIRTNRGS
jgi:hypothetical protein